MRRSWLRAAAVAVALVMIAGPACQAPEPVADFDDLVDRLEAEGATVEPAGTVDQPFFSVQGQIIAVDGEDVQVFEYEDAASVEDAAGDVSADGFTIRGATRTVHVDWMAPPHFYKKGKLLVLYVGDDTEVMQLLDDVLGEQFAGR